MFRIHKTESNDHNYHKFLRMPIDIIFIYVMIYVRIFEPIWLSGIGFYHNGRYSFIKIE